MKTFKYTILMQGALGMLLGALYEIPAFSGEAAKVEVTSFRYAGGNLTHSAELCGKVSGQLQTPIFVKIVVDEKSKDPGIYNAIVGPENKFCITVVTYYGTASASLWNQTQTSSVSMHPEAKY